MPEVWHGWAVVVDQVQRGTRSKARRGNRRAAGGERTSAGDQRQGLRLDL